VGCFSNSKIAALPRTILRATSPMLPIVELLTTMSTGECATGVTNLCAWGSGLERFPAKLADTLGKFSVGIPALTDQVGMLTPKLSIGSTVTMHAKRDQVTQTISLKVVIEKLIRALVVNFEPVVSSAAPLASVVIALKCLLALFIPVRAAIVFVTTEPGVAVFASKGGLAILSITLSVAKDVIVFLEPMWLHVERFAAVGALSGDTLSAYTLTVLTLPESIALLAAKVVLELVLFVGLGLELGTTMVTR